jgi:hypothetical protein
METPWTFVATSLSQTRVPLGLLWKRYDLCRRDWRRMWIMFLVLSSKAFTHRIIYDATDFPSPVSSGVLPAGAVRGRQYKEGDRMVSNRHRWDRSTTTATAS